MKYEAVAKADGTRICGRWVILMDDGVARCDKPESHEGEEHHDSVIDFGWVVADEETDTVAANNLVY